MAASAASAAAVARMRPCLLPPLVLLGHLLQLLLVRLLLAAAGCWLLLVLVLLRRFGLSPSRVAPTGGEREDPTRELVLVLRRLPKHTGTQTPRSRTLLRLAQLPWPAQLQVRLLQ